MEARYGGPETIKERFKASESPKPGKGKKAKKGTKTRENVNRGS